MSKAPYAVSRCINWLATKRLWRLRYDPMARRARNVLKSPKTSPSWSKAFTWCEQAQRPTPTHRPARTTSLIAHTVPPHYPESGRCPRGRNERRRTASELKCAHIGRSSPRVARQTLTSSQNLVFESRASALIDGAGRRAAIESRTFDRRRPQLRRLRPPL